jgi:acetolactate synthase-1/2/3 large subunit
VHGGDRVARVLEGRGVRFVFTLCGGHVSPILTGAKALGLRVVDVRHEATAVFAADAVARLTGVPGVAVVTAGPGVTNTITAIKNAALAQSPLVVIGGAAPTALKGRGALQDIDQELLVVPHVKSFRAVRRMRDLAPAVDEAFDIASEGVPGPAFVECPVDLLYDEATIREWYRAAAGKGKSLADRALGWYLRRHADRLFAPGIEYSARSSPPAVPEPPRNAIASAREAISKSQRPLLVIGSQALACPAEVNEIAQAVNDLGIPAYLSGMARGLLGRDSPLQLRHRRREALREADCVILAGAPCDFRLDYGRHIRRGATLVAANRSEREARLNRGPDIVAVGDAGRFLRALARSLAPGAPSPALRSAWLAMLRSRDLERDHQIANDAFTRGEHVNPLALCRALESHAAPGATFVADGGDFVATASYTVHPRAPLTWLDPGVFGTLGVGAGFALGAKLCRPQEEVWVLWGDGAFGYGLAEYDTFVRHRVGVIGVVGNDASWSQIAREQVKLLGDDVSTVLARTDYHRAVDGLGGAGYLACRDDEVATALDEARATALQEQPALVNAWLDPSAFREGSISM